MKDKKNNMLRSGGFTLVEVLFAVIFVGLAIAALVGSNIAFSQANGAAIDISTAEYLTEQLREMAAMKDYDDLAAYIVIGAGWKSPAFDPPVDARGIALNGYNGFSQEIRAENVSPSDLGQEVANNASPFLRITVRILKNGVEINRTSWIRARY